MYGWDHMTGGGWLFGSVMMVLWIAVFGIVVYVAVRLAQSNHGPDRSSQSD